jgi:alkylation response protein AidB-like acyl-CoA dehydrogenase
MLVVMSSQPDVAEFSASAVRAWLTANCPPSMRTPMTGPQDQVFGGRNADCTDPAAQVWLERMASQGWIAPTWPREYGGAGLSPADARVLANELRSLGCRPPLVAVQGLHMLGPALLEHGTAWQKERFLPAIAAGAERWCQGFSEPDAGSDLAAVRCRAVRNGDEYIVNGEKLWTTHGMHSDWIFAIVRTDSDVASRDGISILLIDLASPGVEVRPLPLLHGESEFAQLTFTDVRVPVRHLLGPENEGWPIVRSILANERRLLGLERSAGLATRRRANLLDLARRRLDCGEGRLPDPVLRDQLTAITFDDLSAKALSVRGGLHPAGLKYTTSRLNQRKADLRARLLGSAGLGGDGSCFDHTELGMTSDYLESRGWTIGGGTSEINLNTVARQELGLPHLGPEVRR